MKSSLLICLALLPLIAKADNLTFALMGDIMMGTTYPELDGTPYLPQNQGRELFSHVDSLVKSADVAIGNLEGTLFDGKGKVKECKDSTLCYAFRTPRKYAGHLSAAGFDLVSVANNHINDFGPEGIKSTLSALDSVGVGSSGLKSQRATNIIIRKNRTVGFVAFSPSKNTLSIFDYKLLADTVRALKRKCDIVVVSMHAGAEGSEAYRVPHAPEKCFGEDRGDVERFAHAAIDAGADLVAGHGPHVTRALELYRNKLILYSLGNFCTPYRVSLKGRNGHAPLVTVEVDDAGNFVRGRIHGFVQQRGKGPVPDAGGNVVRQMIRLSELDFPNSAPVISTDGEISGGAQSKRLRSQVR